MVLPLKPGFAAPFTEAALSPMTEALPGKRPWLRLVAFIPFAFLAMLATMVVLVLIGMAVPALGERMEVLGNSLDETPFRLIEESIHTLIFSVAVGAITFSALAAAALTWRRPLKDFLWPGRRFDLRQFGVGLLLMTAISALWVPVNLATGSEWRPPVFDPYYLGHTRLIYALTMIGALLVAAAAEEVLFRGVVLRVTGLLTRRAIVLCVINGLLFSAIHLDPDPVGFVARAIAGAGWTWAALRLGGLEFAIGSHFANNLFIALMWSPFFSEANEVRQSPWIAVVPEMVTTTIVLIVVEWLSRRRGVPASILPARPAA